MSSETNDLWHIQEADLGWVKVREEAEDEQTPPSELYLTCPLGRVKHKGGSLQSSTTWGMDDFTVAPLYRKLWSSNVNMSLSEKNWDHWSLQKVTDRQCTLIFSKVKIWSIKTFCQSTLLLRKIQEAIAIKNPDSINIGISIIHFIDSLKNQTFRRAQYEQPIRVLGRKASASE